MSDPKKLIEETREAEQYLYEGCELAPDFPTLYADKAHALFLAALASLEAILDEAWSQRDDNWRRLCEANDLVDGYREVIRRHVEDHLSQGGEEK